ncbi:TetR family transcriptional regulator [Komagataeibacter diospyri]|uniref:TetR/AcrR family transcriptional regulator n=1 Tax=Komagataeibacter diospyri TaxID=1932662 RepID=UPI0011379079|nr:TetR/AcrR family transcriptional regulator [Komagataeibacter diospyri]GCE90216.1 TetR family transcriptional regulator [Komagataeibacter diospyri]
MKTTTPPAMRSGSYHKGHVAEDLLRTARNLLDRETAESVSVRRLTREIGVTPANFYNHFSSVHDLLLQIAADSFVQCTRQLRYFQRNTVTRTDALKAALVEYASFAQRHPQTFRIMFGFVPNAISHKIYHNAAIQAFATLLEIVYGQKMLHLHDIEGTRKRARIGYGLCAMGHGLAMMLADGQLLFGKDPGQAQQEMIEGIIDAFIHNELHEALTRPTGRKA